ncbi:MAG: hypothetical protein JWM85_1229 [Acidimicrobiaceae bacterium]|nr:hypothetical protein [Acidimicrobiaceae bacterium]
MASERYDFGDIAQPLPLPKHRLVNELVEESPLDDKRFPGWFWLRLRCACGQYFAGASRSRTVARELALSAFYAHTLTEED